MSKKTKTELRSELEGFEDFFKSWEKEYGENAGRPVTQHRALKMPRFPSGLLTLDKVLGGGVPRGRIMEVFGMESSGKTSLCLQIIAAAQQQGLVGAFIDAEHSLDLQWAEQLGVDVSKLLFYQPMSGEKALNMVVQMVKTKQVGVIVVDSVAALVPLAEMEGEIGEAHVGRQARMIGQTMRILVPLAAETGTTIIFTNQIRMSIGVTWGNPEVTSGGMALKFFASIRLHVRRGKLMDGDERTGDTVTMSCIKNKTSTPYDKGEIDLLYGQGFDRLGETEKLATELGIFTKSGSWYAFGDTRIGQGKEQVKRWLADNPDRLAEIRAKVGEGLDKPA